MRNDVSMDLLTISLEFLHLVFVLSHLAKCQALFIGLFFPESRRFLQNVSTG